MFLLFKSHHFIIIKTWRREGIGMIQRSVQFILLPFGDEPLKFSLKRVNNPKHTAKLNTDWLKKI